MENNQKEVCMRLFFNLCDTDVDLYFSKQEWCCCFQVEVLCDFVQKEVREGKFLGVIMLRCIVEGYFKRMQCNFSIGFCWCADFNGNEIRGIRMFMKKGEFNCGRIILYFFEVVFYSVFWYCGVQEFFFFGFFLGEVIWGFSLEVVVLFLFIEM